LYRKYRSMAALAVLLVAAMLVSGCLGIFSKSYKLTVNVKPEGAAEVKGVDKKYSEGATATFTLEFDAEAYEYVGVDVEGVLVEEEEGVLNVEVADIKENITITFEFEEIEEEPEEPEDPEEAKAAAKEAAEEAIADLPSVVTLAEEEEIAEAIADARGLVDYAVELGVEEDDIEGIEVLEELEERFEAILAQLKGHVIKLETIIGEFADDIVGEGVVFEGDKFDLPETIKVGDVTYVLIWDVDSDLVERDENEIKIVARGEDDQEVVFTATLGIEVGAQAAIPEKFDVAVVVEGWLNRVFRFAAYSSDDDKEGFEEALEGLGIANIDEGKYSEYAEKLKGLLEKYRTKEEIQSAVDEVNGGVVKAFNEAVEAYNKAKTETEKGTKLGKVKTAAASVSGLEVWQDEYVEDYLALVGDGVDNLAALQEIVDDVNFDKLTALVVAAEADVRDADSPWVAARDLYGKIKSRLEKAVAEDFDLRLKEVEAVVTALTGDFSQTWGKEGKGKFVRYADSDINYAGALGDLEGAVTVEDIQALIDDVNAAELKKAIKELVTEAAKEKEDDFATKLSNFVSVATAVVKDFEWTAVSALDYKKAIAESDLTVDSDVEAVLAVLEEVDAIVAINNATDLEDIIVGMKIEKFLNLKSGQRYEVAGLLVVGEGEDGYASTADFDAAVEDMVDEYLGLLAAVNAAGNNVEMMAALEDLSELFENVEFDVDTAEAVLAAKVEAKEDFLTVAEILEVNVEESGNGGDEG